MNRIISEISNVGWHFDNSYARLPEKMLSRLAPAQVRKPKLIVLNQTLSKELGLDFSKLTDEHVASKTIVSPLDAGTFTLTLISLGT